MTLRTFLRASAGQRGGLWTPPPPLPLPPPRHVGDAFPWGWLLLGLVAVFALAGVLG